jgi:hypothetical protein
MLISTTSTENYSSAESTTFIAFGIHTNKLFSCCSQPNSKGNFYTLIENSGWLTMVNKFL